MVKLTTFQNVKIQEPEKSNRQIARMLGVSHPTVSEYRKELESTGKIYQLDNLEGADGKKRRREISH